MKPRTLGVILAIAIVLGAMAVARLVAGDWWTAAGLLFFVLVVLPCAAYALLGGRLLGRVVSLIWPEGKPARFGRCPRCGYDLRGNLDPARCPECGTAIPAELRAR